VPTAEEIEAIETAAAEIAAIGVQSATTGDQTTSVIDPLKLDELAQRQKTRAAAATNGGCGWTGLAKSRVVPGGMTE
jgi:hypothetical protein